MTHLDRERIQSHKRTLDALAEERRTLQARSQQLATLEEQATKARAALDRAVQNRTALVASIDERRDLNAQWTSELEAAQQRLQTSVTALDANAVALPIRPFQGALPWPVRGAVSSRFGRQPSSRFGTSIVRNGIEVALAEGQPVRVVHEGVVAFAGQFTGYGNLVIVEHGERAFSLYGHLSAIQTAQGERIQAQALARALGPQPQRHTRRSTSSSASTASRSIPYNGYRKGFHDLQDPHVRAGALDAGPGVRPRRRPDGRGSARRAPDSRPTSTCGCSTTWSTWC